MKKIYLKTLEDYIAAANGYNQSTHFDVFLWTVENQKKIAFKLFIDNGICDNSLCEIFDEMLEFGAYYAYDFVLLHRCDFEYFLWKMNQIINQKNNR
jgi:hypothetical protein